MNYQEFVGTVTEFLRESLPCGTKLEMLPLEKNNGVIMDGLSIRRQGQKVAPTPGISEWTFSEGNLRPDSGMLPGDRF